LNILIIGGTRFIGKATALLALSKGHKVTLFNRGVTAHDIKANHIRGDIADLPHFKGEFRSLNLDVIIHCICNSDADAGLFLKAFSGFNCRTIILSSMDCYEAFQKANRGQEISDIPIDESAATSTARYYWRGTEHAHADTYDKNLMTEAFLGAFGRGEISPVVLRLPCVYGPEDHQFQNRHGKIIHQIIDQRKTFIMGSIEQTATVTHGYIDNVAAAILHASEYNGSIEGEIFNIGEQKVRTKRRWTDLYSQASGFPFEFEIIPDDVFHETAKIRNNPPVHLVFDCSKFYAQTGFSDPVALKSAVRSTLNWAVENPSRIGARPDYDREYKIFSAYRTLLANGGKG
jgi:nucleoside-diphosphate-sugar epimerase